MTNGETVGRRLATARARAGLSLRDLAGAMRSVVSAQAIGKYERGEMQPSPPGDARARPRPAGSRELSARPQRGAAGERGVPPEPPDEPARGGGHQEPRAGGRGALPGGRGTRGRRGRTMGSSGRPADLGAEPGRSRSRCRAPPRRMASRRRCPPEYRRIPGGTWRQGHHAHPAGIGVGTGLPGAPRAGGARAGDRNQRCGHRRAPTVHAGASSSAISS